MTATTGYGGYPARPSDLYPIVRGVVDTSGVPEEHKHIFRDFDRNLAEPFQGLTTDGVARTELFPLEDTGLDTSELADRARAFLRTLGEPQRVRAQLPVDSDRWRAWINAFAPTPPHGVLLDDLSPEQREAAMGMFAEAFSADGFAQIRTAMRINGELATIAGGYEDTLREWMYWVTVFGRPEPGEPWGFQMYGHHSCVNVFVLDGQITVGPMFVGTEPRIVARPDGSSLRTFDSELELGMAVMRSLPPEQRSQALLAPSMRWADLPPRLAHPTEGRMRGSAARDNAVIPQEGLSAADMSDESRNRLLALLDLYADRLRTPHATLLKERIRRFLPEAHFAWVGDVDIDKPFYYQVHHPLMFIEVDAHAGIFIANDEAESFHIHNIVRTPNGNDYGFAYLRQHNERQAAQQPEPRS